MSRKYPRKRIGTGKVLVAALLLAAIGLGLLFLYRWEARDRARQAEELSSRNQDLLPYSLTVYHDGRWYRLRDNLETYLLLGIDKYSDRLQTVSEGDLVNNLQSDFQMLMVVDDQAKTFTALHINRDTIAEIRRLGFSGQKTGLISQQICLSHTYGSGGKDSCRNSVAAVSRLLYDVPLEHYYAVTMDAIPVLNDLAGGVTVHIEDDFSSVDPTLVQDTDVTLHGQQALTYVRARWYVADETNLNRMNRQRTYMSALYDQLRQKLRSSDRFALSLAETLESYATSDLITDELADLATRLKDYTFTGILSTEGEALLEDEHIAFYPDEESLQATVLRLFFEPKP